MLGCRVIIEHPASAAIDLSVDEAGRKNTACQFDLLVIANRLPGLSTIASIFPAVISSELFS